MTTPSAPVSSSAGTAVPTNTSALDSALRSLATTISSTASAPDPNAVTFPKAVVTAVDVTDTPRSVTLTLDGDSTPVAAVVYLDSYSPNVGDTVLCGQQGSALFVLGQLDAGQSGNGWNGPAYSGGYSDNGNGGGNVVFRRIIDNGARAVQWQGCVALSSPGSATICSIADDTYWPSSRRTLVLGRDSNGSNSVKVDFNTDGTVTIVGETTANTLTGGGNTTSQSGTTSGGHDHNATVSGSLGVSTSDSFSGSGSDNVTGAGVTVSGSGGGSGSASGSMSGGTDNQTVSIGHNHTVSTPAISVAAPVWISFNGVHYFL